MPATFIAILHKFIMYHRKKHFAHIYNVSRQEQTRLDTAKIKKKMPKMINASHTLNNSLGEKKRKKKASHPNVLIYF